MQLITPLALNCRMEVIAHLRLQIIKSDFLLKYSSEISWLGYVLVKQDLPIITVINNQTLEIPFTMYVGN